MAVVHSKILIVEDNDAWRELMAMYIRQSGREVFEAATGDDALKEAAAVHPDLILMDFGLPGMSGDEATAELKANPETRDIPVVVQTAYCTDSHNRRALAAGVEEILHKPIEFTTLEKVIRRYLPGKDEPARTRTLPSPV